MRLYIAKLSTHKYTRHMYVKSGVNFEWNFKDKKNKNSLYVRFNT